VLLGSRAPQDRPDDDLLGRRPAAPRGSAATDVAAALAVADWRRRLAALYADVRRQRDHAAAHLRWAGVRSELIAEHPASPVRAEQRDRFDGLRVAAYDPAWRFVVEVHPAVPLQWSVETGTDGTVVFERLGVAELGEVGRLDVWQLTSYGGGIFVPLKDAGSGRLSYGGGRYVVDTVKGADLGTPHGRLVLDLNFAYAPSCAYDPAWACPLAPEGNTLSVEVPVGELAG
jgi:uncharacterized protein